MTNTTGQEDLQLAMQEKESPKHGTINHGQSAAKKPCENISTKCEQSAGRDKMGGKPVFTIPNRILNLNSGFKEKLLCDGPTFTAGTCCQYRCAFCFVPAVMAKTVVPMLRPLGLKHEDVVVRRKNPVETLRGQQTDRYGQPKYKDSNDRRVIYASPLVDVASNMELVAETVELCKVILELTNWQIRLLSKSNLLPKVAQGLSDYNEPARNRIIYGVSTGTLDNKLAQAFEQGCPLVSKRIESLHWLQDNGFRTFGMICPSLPMSGPGAYLYFAKTMFDAIRADRCEHVWAEVINVRGESFTRTEKALRDAGFEQSAGNLIRVADKAEWEQYARWTFEAHAEMPYKPGQLRFLQYVNKENFAWWKEREPLGAVLLGNITHTDA